MDVSDMDPELARYLNRNYWEQKSEAAAQNANGPVTEPSAPVAQAPEPVTTTAKVQERMQNGDDDQDREQFLHALRSSLEIFNNR